MSSANRFKFYIILIASFLSGNAIFLNGQCNFSQGPVGELCTSAIYVCGSELNGFTSTLPDNLSAKQPWSALCGGNGQADNIIWFAFTPCSPKVTLRITPSNCTTVNVSFSGIQAGLFKACSSASSVDCADNYNNNGFTAPFNLTYNKFEPGVTAYLFIDGYAKSVCDFRIDVIDGIDTSSVITPDPTKLDEGAITGPDKVICIDKGNPIPFNLTVPEVKFALNSSCSQSLTVNPADSICYVWQISPKKGRYFENNDSTGTSKNIIFTEAGTYTISVDPNFHPFYGGSCASGAAGKILSWNVTVLMPDTINQPLQFVCPGEFVSYCGKQISKDTILYCKSDNCTYFRQEFKVGTNKLNILGIKYICQGGSFIFQNISYTAPGSYDVIDSNDCALVHRFSLEIINVSVKILPSVTVLDCNNQEIIITASGSSNAPGALSYSWTDQTGNVLLLNQSLQVVKKGRYKIEAFFKLPGSTCSATDLIDITEDFRKPSVMASKPILRCKNAKDPKPVLSLQTSDNLVATEWTLPSGTKMSGMIIDLDSLNAVSGKPYIFSAIASNGCRLDTSFNVQTNFERAFISLRGDDLTCYRPKDTLLLSTNIPIDSVRWSKTSPLLEFYGSYSSKFTQEINSSGRYRADVMASASKCWSNESIDIFDKINYPEFSIDQGLKWYCNTEKIEIQPNITQGSLLDFQWSTSNGTLISSKNDKNLIAGAPGTYALRILDISNGCSKDGFLEITTENNIPQSIIFSTVDILCYGENNGVLQISNTTGGFLPYQYSLNGQRLNGSQLQNLPKGIYTLEVRDKYNCKYQTTFNISEPELFYVTTENEFNIAFNDVIELNFKSNYGDEEITDIRWTDSSGKVLGTDLTLSYSSIKNDVVFIDVTTKNGCTARSQIKVLVDTELKVYFPNIFSPNGDGFNDRLEIFKNKVGAAIDKISIYDRFGNKVYEQQNFEFESNDKGWDGTFNNSPVEIGVYVMIIQITDFAGNKQILKKDLTLVR